MRKLIFRMKPYFEPSKRNMKNKVGLHNINLNGKPYKLVNWFLVWNPQEEEKHKRKSLLSIKWLKVSIQHALSIQKINRYRLAVTPMSIYLVTCCPCRFKICPETAFCILLLIYNFNINQSIKTIYENNLQDVFFNINVKNY